MIKCQTTKLQHPPPKELSPPPPLPKEMLLYTALVNQGCGCGLTNILGMVCSVVTLVVVTMSANGQNGTILEDSPETQYQPGPSFSFPK